MRIGVVGTGAVGARVFRYLRSREGVTASEMPGGQRRHMLPQLRKKTSADVVVLARPQQVSSAAFYLSRGVSVVSVAGGLSEVENLLALNSLAIGNDATLMAGTAFSPGVSCLLVAKAASEFQLVEEIHVARAGTGGRACARNYHRSLRQRGVEWLEGEWRTRAGGSGRELCWFPDPVGPQDCYRAGLSEPLLLQAAYPKVRRIGARRAARRQDRFTARLPMLTPPPAEGGVGAVRVEVRGRKDGQPTQTVLGAAARPAIAAAALAAEVAILLAEQVSGGGEDAEGKSGGQRADAFAPGATGLAGLVDPAPLLRAVRNHGVTFWRYEGADF